jgi:signal transduction histidine kinase
MRLLLKRYKQDNRSLKAELKAKEQALIHIAMELHDNVNQLLATANLSLDVVKRHIAGTEDFELAQKSQSYIVESINHIRQLSHNIVTDIPADDFNLVTELLRLESFFSTANNCQFKIELQEIEKIKSKQLALNIYRISQELVSNIKKHSGANEASLVIKCNGKTVNITSSDNGTGFTKNMEAVEKGIGLKNIKYRITPYGGDIKTGNNENCGAIVHITIPIVKRIRSIKAN